MKYSSRCFPRSSPVISLNFYFVQSLCKFFCSLSCICFTYYIHWTSIFNRIEHLPGFRQIYHLPCHLPFYRVFAFDVAYQYKKYLYHFSQNSLISIYFPSISLNPSFSSNQPYKAEPVSLRLCVKSYILSMIRVGLLTFHIIFKFCIPPLYFAWSLDFPTTSIIT